MSLTVWMLVTLARAATPDAQRAAVHQAWAQQAAQDRARRASTLARLQAETLVGVELLVAEGTRTPVQSRWGHALLRFVDADADALDDAVLGFVADPGGPTLSLWSGVVGGYPVIADLGPLHWVMATYVRDQLRPVTRWVLPTDAQARGRLVETLTRWSAPGATDPGGYTFAGNNCAWALLRYLDAAGVAPLPAARGLGPHIPTRLPRHVQAKLRPAPPIPALGDVVARAAGALGIPFARARAGDWPDDVSPLLGWPPDDILRLLLNVDVPAPAAEALRGALPENTRADLVALYGVEPLGADAYGR